MRTWLTIVVVSAFAIPLLWATSIPLGVPGEWAWHRLAPEPDTFWNLCGGAIVAGLLIVFVLFVRRRLETRPVSTWAMNGYLVCLALFSFCWIWVVQEISPVQNRLGKCAFVLYYASSSGYFTRARYEQPKAAELLAHYEELMGEGDVLHTGTHPPGLFLVFHGLIAACDSSQSLGAVLDATQPESFRDACDIIASLLAQSSSSRPMLPTDRRVLWLATLLVMVAAAATVIPLFHLVRRHRQPADAWVVAALWPAVPAVAVFVPKSDALFPFVGATFLALWLMAWDRRSLWLAFLTGVVAWCGVICSLAFLPIFLVAALISIGSVVIQTPRVIEAKRVLCVAFAAIGFTVPTVMVSIVAKANLLMIWFMNYRNHANFYREYSRTYWAWLLMNPLELAFAVGCPIAVLALLGAFGLLRSTEQKQTKLELGVVVFVWGILWLTGKNSGEAARLWLIFMPWMLWLASSQIAVLVNRGSTLRDRQRYSLIVLAMQFAVCLLTVSRVNGFHVTGG